MFLNQVSILTYGVGLADHIGALGGTVGNPSLFEMGALAMQPSYFGIR